MGNELTAQAACYSLPWSQVQITMAQNGINIYPPLLNAASPWSSTEDQLRKLYDCPYTGAVTIQTSLLNGFQHDPTNHKFLFLNISKANSNASLKDNTSCFDTMVYSSTPFLKYLSIIDGMYSGHFLTGRPGLPVKPFILSVTGTAAEVAVCYSEIATFQGERQNGALSVWMEINLSCPNILGLTPPAFDEEALFEYMSHLSVIRAIGPIIGPKIVTIGLKIPPFTNTGQFDKLISCLERATLLPRGCPISFITATNTLGNCVILNKELRPRLHTTIGTAMGSLAGDVLHPLALGNVLSLGLALRASQYMSLHSISIIGVGGVRDKAGYDRMREAGAVAVGVATALGREGTEIFKKITLGE